ncbi:hypothetical protein ZHAS_00006337 [Anopheles sinensis]|uniref:Uncharacterized protein n=1 Tax=Anopheles sinensis TaxID=74873 RepID=A0A084VLK5_ANOSI|nr:hypothetical protein ZHAS_00006337 [Anopheles sinensis]
MSPEHREISCDSESIPGIGSSSRQVALFLERGEDIPLPLPCSHHYFTICHPPERSLIGKRMSNSPKNQHQPVDHKVNASRAEGCDNNFSGAGARD